MPENDPEKDISSTSPKTTNSTDSDLTESAEAENSSDREISAEFRHYSGPIPSPETFAQYKEVSPKLVDAIISQWQETSAHIRQMESREMICLEKDQASIIQARTRGQWAAVLFCYICLLASIVFFWFHYYKVGSMFLTLGAVDYAWKHYIFPRYCQRDLSPVRTNNNDDSGN